MRIDVNKIINHIKNVKSNIVIGIDGYVDEVWQIINTRSSLTDFSVYSRMSDFGERILRCGAGGLANEIVQKRVSYGGFTGNTGNAVRALGIRPIMLGMFGKNGLNPVFGKFTEDAELISIGDPAVCHIYEFEDGKIMLPYTKAILTLSWETLTASLTPETLSSIFSEADVIALGYWTNMHDFDNIVINISGLARANKPRRLFLDLADINKRDAASLEMTLTVLKELGKTLPVTLSLNEHEAALLFSRRNEDFNADAAAVEKTADIVRRRLGFDEIVIHTPRFAAIASEKEGTASIKQIFCEKPVKTAGAGDTFNGGYLASLSGGLNLKERLALANAASGYYVGNGEAPRPNDLRYLLELLAAE